MTDAVDAARIAAQATICAAWIQGGLTVAAGFAAVVGGYFAYLGALRQVRLEEQRDKARVAAYSFRIRTLLHDLDVASALRAHDAVAFKRFYKASANLGSPVPLMPLPFIEDFAEEHWENHALLGQEVVRAIHDIRVKLKWYESFCNEVLKGKLRGTDVPFWHSQRKADPVEKADGSIEISMQNVVEVNETLTTEIRQSVKNLQAAMKNDPDFNFP